MEGSSSSSNNNKAKGQPQELPFEVPTVWFAVFVAAERNVDDDSFCGYYLVLNQRLQYSCESWIYWNIALFCRLVELN
jgi:hypothetical protein